MQDSDKLIKPLPDVGENVKKFVHAKELFDLLNSSFLSIEQVKMTE